MNTRRTGRPTGRLLVIDFDFFFPNPSRTTALPMSNLYLYDWGHQETPFHRELIWPARAATFAASGQTLPRCSGIDELWSRFQLHTTTLLAADSNTFAGDLTGPAGRAFAEVVLFDAHHDSGYDRTLDEFAADRRYTCEDWTFNHYARGSEIIVRYPPWLPDWQLREPSPQIPVKRSTDDGQPIPGAFDAVFCCRSGSWVPPWCDDQWTQLLNEFPGQVKVIDPVLHSPRWNSQRQQEYDDLLETITAAIGNPRAERRAGPK